MDMSRLTFVSRPSLVVVFVLAAFGTWNCGSSDGPNENENVDYSTLSEASLVGTWKHDSYAATTDGSRTDVSRDISWTFRKNGNATYNQGQSSNDFTWSLDDQNIMFGDTNQYTVVEYSEDEMIWRNNQGPDPDGRFYFVSRQ